MDIQVRTLAEAIALLQYLERTYGNVDLPCGTPQALAALEAYLGDMAGE